MKNYYVGVVQMIDLFLSIKQSRVLIKYLSL